MLFSATKIQTKVRTNFCFFHTFFMRLKYIFISQNINHVDEVYYIYLSINAHMRMYKTTITLLYKVKDIILTQKIKFNLMQKEEIKD